MALSQKETFVIFPVLKKTLYDKLLIVDLRTVFSLKNTSANYSLYRRPLRDLLYRRTLPLLLSIEDLFTVFPIEGLYK